MAMAHVRAGKLRALAVTSARRYEALPDLPTIGEFLPGYEATITPSHSASARPRTPRRHHRQAQQKNQRCHCRSGDQDQACQFRSRSRARTPAEFGKLLADETEKWRGVIQSAGIKPQ
jgi:tripartite-type tricarboxylate transporter receptor subunit TctC